MMPLLLKRMLGYATLGAGGGKSWTVTFLLGFLTHFTYVALAGVLIVASMGLPIPEDIPLVLSGYLSNPQVSPIGQVMVDEDSDGIPDTMEQHAQRVPKWYWMATAGILGVLVGDTIVFNIGRHGIESNNIVARHLRKVMHTKRREKVERHFARHGNLTVFVGRFMPGFRSIVFAFAGLAKMSYARFLLIDGAAALISVPFFIFLGYHFAAEIDGFLQFLERIRHIVAPAAAVILVGAIILYILRRRRLPAVQNL